MRKPTSIGLTATIVLLLAGCVPRTLGIQASSTYTAPGILTETHTPPTPTASVTRAPSPSIIPSATSSEPRIPSDANLDIHCLEVADRLSPNQRLEGRLVLDRIDQSIEAYLMNLETEEQLLLSGRNENPVFFAVSPDGHWLAFKQFTLDDQGQDVVAETLKITSGDPGDEISIAWQPSWADIVGWLNNHLLMFSSFEDSPVKYQLLDPFSMESQHIPAEFHDLETLYKIPSWEGLEGASLSPDMSHVITARLSPETIQPGNIRGYEYVLREVESDLVLSTLPAYDDFFKTPKWSSDGQQAIIAALINPDDRLYELYRIRKDGEIEQLTHLSAYFEAVHITSYSWSPDGRYVAFWMVAGPGDFHDERLSVLDVVTGRVTDLCIYGNFGGPPHIGEISLPPVWSPNSQQLAVETRYAENDTSQVILVDLVQEYAVQVAENLRPRGWLLAER